MVGGSCSLYVYTLLSKKSFTKFRFSSILRRDLFNNALEFYEGVETIESFEKEFKPIADDTTLTPMMLVLILVSIGFLRKVDPDSEGGGMW